MVPEAPLRRTDAGLVPEGEGWFVVNARETGWNESAFGPYCRFEGDERPLKAWDFVHCPAWTEHVLVGAGGGPCVILAVGSRTGGGGVYPASELALRHGAGVERETTSPDEAYARFPADVPAAFRPGWLPDC